MPLSNAEKQRRWRDRNQILLTDSAADIAEKLIEMADQAKLKKVAQYVNDHLKHPDRDPYERGFALGKLRLASVNGPLSKKASLEAYRKPAPTHSWRVEAITGDGKRWSSGVRLRTKEEAEAYRDYHARFDLEKAGYVTAEVLAADERPNCSISRKRRGGRTTLGFMHGKCVLLHWHCGGECIMSPSS
jgi:hypothetical protein